MSYTLAALINIHRHVVYVTPYANTTEVYASAFPKINVHVLGTNIFLFKTRETGSRKRTVAHAQYPLK